MRLLPGHIFDHHSDYVTDCVCEWFQRCLSVISENANSYGHGSVVSLCHVSHVVMRQVYKDWAKCKLFICILLFR